eukprot:CFRG1627T1
MRSLTNLMSSLRSGKLPLQDYYVDLEAIFVAHEPHVFAFVPEKGRFDRLHREADALIKQFPDISKRPPLFGVPVGIKDIIHVHGFETRCGSRVPSEVLQNDTEAIVVSKLKAAGALIMGKTVTAEFAGFAPGPTNNPHNHQHTSGGSSSGSAAAVGAGMCPVAVGTQTSGSINRPGAFCGVPGWKPSFGRTSCEGIMSHAPSYDHVGLLAQDVRGIAACAPIIALDWQPVVTNTKLPTLGIPVGPYLKQVQADGLAQFEKDCACLIRAGYVLKSVDIFPDIEDIVSRHRALMAAEMAAIHKEWFPKYRQLYEKKTAEEILEGQGVTENTQAIIRATALDLRASILQSMGEVGIDMWITPGALGPAPFGKESTGNPAMQVPWTQSGLPMLNVRTGANDANLPFGLQMIAGWYRDEVLLEWGSAVEELFA